MISTRKQRGVLLALLLVAQTIVMGGWTAGASSGVCRDDGVHAGNGKYWKGDGSSSSQKLIGVQGVSRIRATDLCAADGTKFAYIVETMHNTRSAGTVQVAYKTDLDCGPQCAPVGRGWIWDYKKRSSDQAGTFKQWDLKDIVKCSNEHCFDEDIFFQLEMQKYAPHELVYVHVAHAGCTVPCATIDHTTFSPDLWWGPQPWFGRYGTSNNDRGSDLPGNAYKRTWWTATYQKGTDNVWYRHSTRGNGWNWVIECWWSSKQDTQTGDGVFLWTNASRGGAETSCSPKHRGI